MAGAVRLQLCASAALVKFPFVFASCPCVTETHEIRKQKLALQ